MPAQRGHRRQGTNTHRIVAVELSRAEQPQDFRNRREVASYFGLTPSPWHSGGIDRDQGISKAGNPRARCAAIELAWLWLRHQPDSALTQWFRQRTLNAGKRIKRTAIVALARKLIVALCPPDLSHCAESAQWITGALEDGLFTRLGEVAEITHDFEVIDETVAA